jgi:hypothetical protein
MIPGTVLEFGDRGLSLVDPPAARAGQSSGAKTGWISFAAVFAGVLLVIAGIMVVAARRRCASLDATNWTESYGYEVASDIDAFLSEENGRQCPDGNALGSPE